MFRRIFAGYVCGCHLNQMYMFADCCMECCIHACASVHVYTCMTVCTGQLTITSLVNCAYADMSSTVMCALHAQSTTIEQSRKPHLSAKGKTCSTCISS